MEQYSKFIKIIYTNSNKLVNMFCENCGKEIPDNARFCGNCGNQIKKTNNIVTEEKNMILALFLSIFFMGLGLVYAGDKKKGIILFIAILLFNNLRKFQIFFIISIILWAYAIYETYREVKMANGEEKPNLLEDIEIFSHSQYFAPAIVIAILLVVYYLLIRTIFY